MSDPASTDRNEGLWVRSDVTADGTYILTVELDQDITFALDPDQAVTYASHVIGVCARAEYDAAVLAQLVSTGIDKAHAAQSVAGLRADRPPLTGEWPWPVTFNGIVASKTLAPLVQIAVGGKQVGQVGTGALVEHATNVLECLVVAELDAGYRRWLVGSVGLDDDKARAAVDGLAAHRQRS